MLTYKVLDLYMIIIHDEIARLNNIFLSAGGVRRFIELLDLLSFDPYISLIDLIDHTLVDKIDLYFFFLNNVLDVCVLTWAN